jgi:two-component system, NtrC family, nitrogen regulation response regulator GlnG
LRGSSREKIYQRALAEFEIPLLQHIMRQAKGNQLKAASLLGINRNTLRKKLTEYAIGSNGTG